MSNWEALVREQGPVVFRSAWRILRDAHEAEDVAQEVLLELFRRPRGEPITSGLLVCIAVRRAIDLFRRRHPPQRLAEQSLVSAEAGPVREAIGRELEDRLREAVARLPARQAEVFCLRYLHDTSYDEIARNLGISRDAVAVALHQARQRLRESLGSIIEEPCR